MISPDDETGRLYVGATASMMVKWTLTASTLLVPAPWRLLSKI